MARVRSAFPEATGPIAVHRLDMATSGLMVVALTVAAHRALSMQFEARRVEKTYIALLNGVPSLNGGVIELPLRLDVENRPVQIHDPIHGRPCCTTWRALAFEGARTRVEFTPLTGRTHQLRVHAALGIGYPIVGDRLYGSYGSITPATRLMLHANWLAFAHPTTGARCEFASTVPF